MKQNEITGIEFVHVYVYVRNKQEYVEQREVPKFETSTKHTAKEWVFLPHGVWTLAFFSMAYLNFHTAPIQSTVVVMRPSANVEVLN